MKTVELIKDFLNLEETYYLFESLKFNITWHENMKIGDSEEYKKIPRKMGYVSDIENFTYKYANFSFPGQVWYPALKTVRDKLNKFTGRNFNSVLLNWYKDGKDEIKWHADKEEILGDRDKSVIACVNFGATRKFWFMNLETKERFFYPVSNGDLLMMNAGCQSEYLHAILKEKEITESRISLTFREVQH